MKRIYIIATILSMSLAAFADDYNLFVEGNDGKSIYESEVKNIQKITFEASNIVFTKKDGTSVQKPLNEVNRLYFDSNPLAVEKTESERNEGNADIHDLQGRKVKDMTVGFYIKNKKKVLILNR